MVDTTQHVHGTALPAQHSGRWNRYVAIGDSLSEGLGDPLHRGEVRGWAHLLAQHLRRSQPDLVFTNLAVRGHLARNALREQLEPALALEPDLVSVFIGGNDVLLRPAFRPERFDEDLSALVEPFAGRATVVLSTLPDLTACSPLPPPVRGRLRQRIVAANQVIRETAQRYDTVLLDAWADPRTRRHAMWSIDRIHPSAEGHRLIAASVAGLLRVPLDPDAHVSAPAAIIPTVRRYVREAAWLLRYAAARPVAGAPRGDAV